MKKAPCYQQYLCSPLWSYEDYEQKHKKEAFWKQDYQPSCPACPLCSLSGWCCLVIDCFFHLSYLRNWCNPQLQNVWERHKATLKMNSAILQLKEQMIHESRCFKFHRGIFAWVIRGLAFAMESELAWLEFFLPWARLVGMERENVWLAIFFFSSTTWECPSLEGNGKFLSKRESLASSGQHRHILTIS